MIETHRRMDRQIDRKHGDKDRNRLTDPRQRDNTDGDKDTETHKKKRAHQKQNHYYTKQE